MLNRVRIKNFRSLDVDVKLDPVTVLVGKSGTGKTNFVEALRFLRDYLRISNVNEVPTPCLGLRPEKVAAARQWSGDGKLMIFPIEVDQRECAT